MINVSNSFIVIHISNDLVIPMCPCVIFESTAYLDNPLFKHLRIKLLWL